MRLSPRCLALFLILLMLAALPLAAAAPGKGPQRYPAEMFPLFLSDELQGPLLGPVKKATLRAGESWWSVTFALDGKPIAREQFVPGLSHELILYENGRAVKRIENPGTDKQAESFVRYDGSRAFKVEFTTKDGKTAEISAGTLTPQGLVATRTSRYSDGAIIYHVAYDYSPAGLPIRETAQFTKRGTITIERVFDTTGRIITRSQLQSPPPDAPANTAGQNRLDYRYDTKGQLTEAYFQATTPPITVTLAIQGEYDKYGNWTKLTMTRRETTAGQQPAQPQIFTQQIEYY